MARLPILEYPDPRLRIRAEPVTKFDAGIESLVSDLLETMYAAPGIGLAATQVNVHKRVIVLDISDERNEPYCLINPEIVSAAGRARNEEGCLSVPDEYEMVERPARVKLRALDRQGAAIELDADGLLAACIQHEIDHLDGKLFIDHLSELKRQRLKKRTLKKNKRGEQQDESARRKTLVPLL